MIRAYILFHTQGKSKRLNKVIYNWVDVIIILAKIKMEVDVRLNKPNTRCNPLYPNGWGDLHLLAPERPRRKSYVETTMGDLWWFLLYIKLPYLSYSPK